MPAIVIGAIIIFGLIGMAASGSSQPDNANIQLEQTSENDSSRQLSEPVTVAGVTDGDTVKVNLDGEVVTVRLIGIDTPETVHPSKPQECYGKEASAHLKNLIVGKSIQLESDSTQSDKDRYDRLLRFIILEDGTNINEKMVADGFAYEYTYDSNPYKYQTKFKSAQTMARDDNRGLWAEGTCNGKREKAQVKASEPKPEPKPEPKRKQKRKPNPKPER